MRLIRLQTDQDNCMFDNSFQDDILIQPGAKIALQNVCILKTPESVYIGNLDITITYQISGADSADPPTAILETGSYNTKNFDTLLSDITTKMNRELDITKARHLGIQWKAHLVDNVVQIEYEQPFRTPLKAMISKFNFVTSNGVTTSGAVSLVAQGDATETTGAQFIYVNAPITKGCGIFSAKVVDLIATAGGSTGFILGLVAKQAGTISKIEKAKYLFGVTTRGASSSITSALVNGNTAATTGSTAQNDFVGIEMHTNQVHMVLYKNASPTKTVIHSVDIDPSVDYYPAITFFDDSSTKLQTINCALDPFASPVLVNEPSSAVTVEDVQNITPYHHLPAGNPWTQNAGSNTESFDTVDLGIATYRRVQSTGFTQWWRSSGENTWDLYNSQPDSSTAVYNTATIDNATGVISFPSSTTTFIPSATLTTISGLQANPLRPSQAPSIHTINFSSMTLPTFLGYRLQTYSTAAINPARFKADALFDITDTADSFVVELLSLELDSYNSVDTPTVRSGGRRSILATVPKTEGVDGTIVYEVNYPTFIDIRNKNPVAIRNIRARILKSDLSSMIISGTATMTLLLDN